MFPLLTTRKGRTILFRYPTIFLLACAITARAQKLNETILYGFTNSMDGNYPVGGVIHGQDDSLYGTTSYGGTNGFGTLFKINRDGNGYRVLRHFDSATGSGPNGLAQATNGLLYGATTSGGSNSVGAIFSINTNGTSYKQLHAFSTSDGAYPAYGLFCASNGVIYGTASQGGISNAGTAFRMNLDGSGFQVLHQFTNSPDGASPASIMQAADGVLYGGAVSGGISNAGIVFRLTTNGNSYSILRLFTNSPDGANPEANFVQGKDGMLYGTTVFGGATYIYGGTLFKMNTNGGSYAVLHSFPSIAGDGINADALTITADGTIYGVAANSGASSSGMVFRLDTNGNYTVAFGFGTSPPDGRNPVAALTDGGDGALYGTADHGGTADLGIVYRLAPPLQLSAQISSSAGTNTSVFSWPAWASGYGVRTSATLSNTTWTAINAPVRSGSTLFTTNKSTALKAFFRLQTPP